MNKREFNDKLLSLQPNLLNFAYILTSSRKSAYDLVQKTTLEALGKADSYDGSEFELKSWIFQIMRTLSPGIVDKREHVSHQYRERITGLAVATDVPEGAVSVEAISRALNEVSGERRQFLTMHLKGYTSVEISKSTGQSLKSVRKSLVSAWHRLTVHISKI